MQTHSLISQERISSKNSQIIKIPLRNTNWRWFTVGLASITLFGGYFGEYITNSLYDSFKTSLNNDEDLLSLLSGIIIYPNIIFSVFGGLLISIKGISFSIFFFSFLVAIGHFIFGIPCFINDEYSYNKYYGLAIGGRIMFGIGFESLGTGINTLIAKWFGKQEYCFALSLGILVWRSATVLSGVTINSSNNLSFGLNVLISLIVGIIGSAVGICLSFFEGYANKRDIKTHNMLYEEIDSFRWEYIGRLSTVYWIIVIFRGIMYLGMYSFTSNSKDYLQSVYKFNDGPATMLSNVNFGFSIILLPIVGWLIDRKGKRINFGIISTMLMTGSNILYIFLPKQEKSFWWIMPSILSGISYSIFSIAVNSMIYIVVLTEAIGLAYGISSSIQNFWTSIGVVVTTQFFVGDNTNNYLSTNIFGMSFSILGFILSILLYRYSKRNNLFVDLQGIFNRAFN